MATSMANKLIVGAGAAVIVTMLLIAAFSIGVYVGENGWTWRGVSLAGPGGPPGRPALPGQAPPGGPALPGQAPPGGPAAGGVGQPPVSAPGGPALPPRPPDLRGRVQSLRGDILGLASPDGPRAVQLTDQTQIHTAEGESAARDALQPGVIVAVFGHRGDGGTQLIANNIIILRP